MYDTESTRIHLNSLLSVIGPVDFSSLSLYFHRHLRAHYTFCIIATCLHLATNRTIFANVYFSAQWNSSSLNIFDDFFRVLFKILTSCDIEREQERERERSSKVCEICSATDRNAINTPALIIDPMNILEFSDISGIFQFVWHRIVMRNMLQCLHWARLWVWLMHVRCDSDDDGASVNAWCVYALVSLTLRCLEPLPFLSNHINSE